MRLKKDLWINHQPVAHRGFHSEGVPENSMAAFERAIEKKYAIEMDVHLTLDGHLIVFHDDHTKRMTGVDKKTGDLIFKDLNELRLQGTDQKIPLFSDFLDLVKGRVPLMIEIKNTSKVGMIEQELMRQLRSYKGAYVVQAFNPFRVKWLRKNAPEVIRGQLSGLLKNDKDLSAVNKFVLRNLILNLVTRPDFVNYEIAGLNKGLIKFLRLIGYPVFSWTARDPETYDQALKLSRNSVFEGFTPPNQKE